MQCAAKWVLKFSNYKLRSSNFTLIILLLTYLVKETILLSTQRISRLCK